MDNPSAARVGPEPRRCAIVNYKPHTLVSFGGVLNAGVPDEEIWQCGVRVQNAAGGPLADPAGYLLSIEAAMAGWFSSTAAPTVSFPSVTKLSWLKANNIGTDGKYTDDTSHVYDYNPIVSGGAAPASHLLPDVLCVAVTWVTRKAIRRHSYATHGRVYLPGFVDISEDGKGGMRMPAGVPADWATRGAALLHTLAPAGFAGGVVAVIASGHAQEIEPIIGVRCGNVFDIQRRRKDALAEVYSSAAYVPN